MLGFEATDSIRGSHQLWIKHGEDGAILTTEVLLAKTDFKRPTLEDKIDQMRLSRQTIVGCVQGFRKGRKPSEIS